MTAVPIRNHSHTENAWAAFRIRRSAFNRPANDEHRRALSRAFRRAECEYGGGFRLRSRDVAESRMNAIDALINMSDEVEFQSERRFDWSYFIAASLLAG